MNALFFVLFAIVLALIIFLFCKLAALGSHYDDLMDKVFNQEEQLKKHESNFETQRTIIVKNQQAIDEIKEKSIRSLCVVQELHAKRLSAVEEKVESSLKGSIVVGPMADANSNESADDTAAETDAEDEPTERQARQPYPQSVREMAEKFIIAEYSTTSIKTIAKLLNIPRATVQRWTKQLIKRGAIQPKKQPTQE